MSKAAEESEEQMPSWREAFLYFLFLGFVSVGGPVAQITTMFKLHGRATPVAHKEHKGNIYH